TLSSRRRSRSDTPVNDWTSSRNCSRSWPGGASHSMSAKAALYRSRSARSSRARWPRMARPTRNRPPHSMAASTCSSRLRTSRDEIMGFLPSPDGNLQLQLHAEAILNPAANEIDQPQHLPAGGAGMDHDETGVALADLDAADPCLGQASLFDESRGAQAARV